MAFRRPLYWDSLLGGPREMSDAHINEIRAQAYWLYLANPSVLLEVVLSGANLTGDVPYDSRLQAGDTWYSTTGFPGEWATAEPSIVWTSFYRLKQTSYTYSIPTDTNNTSYPVYYDGTGIRAMTLTDMFDTFIDTAISSYIHGTSGSVYTISAAYDLSGYYRVSDTPVFTDTRANAAAFTADSIPEVLDQPTTISNFYLHRRNNSSQAYTVPLRARTDGNLIQHDSFDSVLQECIKYATTSRVGDVISYATVGSTNTTLTGVVHGSGMTDTRLDGSGNYQELFVNGDDYRAQEFPNGSPYTSATYYLISQLS